MRLLLLIFSILFLSCSQDKKEVKTLFAIDEVKDSPDQISYDFSVYFMDSSLVKAYLKADRARIYEKQKETKLDSHVVVDFYSKENGKKVSYLKADSVTIDDATKNMIAMGNVVVVSDSNKTTVRTSILEWNNETRKLTSDKYVKIVSPDQEIEGIGFESDETLKNYTIYKVKGVKYK
ncbi:MAG: LPS export ABC transporter periplasmic protein LptC [Candidatus Kapaibacterium sp.]